MRIGLRTVKTAVSATLAILSAIALQLSSAPSAGIIAVLSLTNTKRSSLETGFSRLLSLALATLISALCFSLCGFTTWAFGIYLLLFIPCAVRLRLSEGIVVSSVLVTHYLSEASLAPQLILNEFLLMSLGVGWALLLNLYMPSSERALQENQEKIETGFRRLLCEMALSINDLLKEQELLQEVQQLLTFIRQAEEQSVNFQENHWFSQNLYYSDYFAMRRAQAQVLQQMIRSMEKIHVAPEQIANMRVLLEVTASAFSQDNDGQELLAQIFAVYEEYRAMPLPQTREEFENRAELFQFLQSFKSFIEIKAEFAQTSEKAG